MLHIAKPIIILSSLLQPTVTMPHKSMNYYAYEVSHREPLPFQNVNNLITSEDMLIHILQEQGISNENQGANDKK